MRASFFEVPTMSQALAMHSQNPHGIPQKGGFCPILLIMKLKLRDVK